MRKSPLLPIFLIVAVDVLGLTIVLPLLPFYAERYGASPFVVGLLVTVYALCQLISGPLLGKLSDKTGRKPLLLVSQVGTLIGFLILAFSNSLWMIFVSRVIDGATAGNLSLAQAYISDVTEARNRAKAFGLIGIAFGLGFLIGPAISGFLSQFGYQYPILAAAGLSLTSIFATYFFLPGGKPAAHTHTDPGPGGRRLGVLDWSAYATYFKRPELRILLEQFMLFFVSFALFTSGFALFAERRFTSNGVPFGPREVGYVFAYTGLIGATIQGGLIGKLVQRFGEARLVAIGFGTAALAYFGLGWVSTVPALLCVATLSSFGHAVLRPTITSLISQRTGRHEQGVVLGLTQSLNSIAQIIAPMIGGLLIDHHFLTTWAWCAAVSSFLGVILSRRLFRPTGEQSRATA